jgi:hypothetical protein
MAAAKTMSVEEGRATLRYLHAATQAADPGTLAPSDWIKRFHQVVRVVAPRDAQYRYRVNSVLGITMGRLARRVAALLSDFDGLVEDNPRLRAGPEEAGGQVRSSPW